MITAGYKHMTRCSGQVMTEYAIMLVFVLFISIAMVMLMAVFSEYGWRMITLAGMDI